MNQSFALTTAQYRAHTKFVTRRNGWKHAYVGQVVTAVEKGQGLKKGEHPVKLGQHRFTDLRWERLDRMLTEPEYGAREVILEGFPDMTPAEFVAMYCKHNRCAPDMLVHRMAFEYL